MIKYKKVLITGGTGMVGSNLLEYGLRQHSDVQFRATYFTQSPFLKDPKIEWVRADLTKKEDCAKAVQGCDAAILASAVTGGAKEAQNRASRQVTDNLIMDALCLEAMHSAAIQRTIYLSSATVYPDHDGFIKENELDLNQEPHSAYFGVGWAKRSAEKLCTFWHLKYDMPILVFRCSNIYGPYSTMNPDRSHFIPALLRKAESRMDPFEIWGDPQARRDVLFAQDLADAAYAALKRTDLKFDIFNAGAGTTVTVDQVAKAALECAGHTPKKISYKAGEPQTIRTRALDCSKINDVLGWRAKTSLQEGMAKTFDWWKQNKEHWGK